MEMARRRVDVQTVRGRPSCGVVSFGVVVDWVILGDLRLRTGGPAREA